MLKGKNAVITGANRGIGRAVTELFAANGANIWACAREENASFKRDMKELSGQYGIWTRPVFFDFADKEAVAGGARSILETKEPVDILVNNAGVTAAALLMQTSIEEIEHVFSINFFSQLLLIQKLSKRMIRQKTGSIINIASTSGIEARTGRIAYGSSKAALIMATRVLSKELGRHGVRVNAVAPGRVKTNMLDENVSLGINSDFYNDSKLGRLGEPEEIARTILFLASELSSYINGEVIRADGGWL